MGINIATISFYFVNFECNLKFQNDVIYEANAMPLEAKKVENLNCISKHHGRK